MNQRVLKINWAESTEFVPVNDTTAPTQSIQTRERWCKTSGSPLVSYTASVENFTHSDENNTLQLRYKESDQDDARAVDNDSWGVSIINWNSLNREGEAEWIDDHVSDRNGKVSVTLLGDGSPVNENQRKTASVIVKLRPKQAELRDALLCVDKSCVLTAETEGTALDAAHIVPVKSGGEEIIDNAILLRADLHRLFDAGLFWFEMSAEGASLKYSKSLSDNYITLLTRIRLPNSTVERVAQALRIRATLTGGAGDQS